MGGLVTTYKYQQMQELFKNQCADYESVPSDYYGCPSYNCSGCKHCTLANIYDPDRIVYFCEIRQMIVCNLSEFGIKDSRELYDGQGKLLQVIEPGDEVKWMKEVEDAKNS